VKNTSTSLAFQVRCGWPTRKTARHYSSPSGRQLFSLLPGEETHHPVTYDASELHGALPNFKSADSHRRRPNSPAAGAAH